MKDHLDYLQNKSNKDILKNDTVRGPITAEYTAALRLYATPTLMPLP